MNFKVGISDLAARKSRIGVLLESIIFSHEGITLFPKISACNDT